MKWLKVDVIRQNQGFLLHILSAWTLKGLRLKALTPWFVIGVQMLSRVWLFATKGLQHNRLLCSSLSPGICSDSCPLSQWCYLTLSSSATLPSIFPSIMVPSSESALHIRWPKYWSFSISPSNEYSGVISLPCRPRDSKESFPTPQFENINSSVLNLLCGPTLTSVHNYWVNHRFDYMDPCQQSDVSAFKYIV